MRVYHSIDDFSAQNPVVTIGTFDGVHAGHQRILQQLQLEKEKYNGESVLLTFWPHPRVFFGKIDHFSMLTSIEEKLELLEKYGLDVCVILPFSQEFAQQSPDDYIVNILCKGLHAKKVIVGYDHKYGKNGLGTFALMQEYARKMQFEVEQVSAYSVESETVSSTKVRKAISNGDIAKANQLLQYEYFLQGSIVSGSQIGRTIGFPTANVHVDFVYKQLPKIGVYAAKVVIEEKQYKAVVNIGNNPTIQDNLPLSIEVHVIDFCGNLYNKNIRVQFVARLRDEQHFSSIEALKCAIRADVEHARMFI